MSITICSVFDRMCPDCGTLWAGIHFHLRVSKRGPFYLVKKTECYYSISNCEWAETSPVLAGVYLTAGAAHRGLKRMVDRPRHHLLP